LSLKFDSSAVFTTSTATTIKGIIIIIIIIIIVIIVIIIIIIIATATTTTTTIVLTLPAIRPLLVRVLLALPAEAAIAIQVEGLTALAAFGVRVLRVAPLPAHVIMRVSKATHTLRRDVQVVVFTAALTVPYRWRLKYITREKHGSSAQPVQGAQT
jgi:hypothetical protein